MVHRDAATAHAAATALFMAGPREWHALAADMGVDQVILIDSGGTLHVTANLQPRLRFMDTNHVIRVRNPRNSEGTS